MKLTITVAQQWKNWRLSQMRDRIKLYEELLRMERNEYAALNNLHGNALALRYGAESPADLEPFEADRKAWTEQVTRLFEESELSRSAAA